MSDSDPLPLPDEGIATPLERWIQRFEAWCKSDTENGTDMICEVLDEMRAVRDGRREEPAK
jgi:hypothetical protein